jgi:hypothetical protein
MDPVERIQLAVLLAAGCSSAPYTGPRSGLVSLGESDTAGSASSNAIAQFTVEPVYGTPAATDGPCTLFGMDPSDGYGAGEIELSGTMQPISLDEQGDPPHVTYVASTEVPDPVFVPGAQLSVTAQGDIVPAFTASVIGPMPLEGWTPPSTLSRSGYSITWTPGTGSSIQLVIGADHPGTADGGAAILCILDDTGAFELPASTFALIPAADDEAILGIGRLARTTVMAGEVSVVFQASISTLTGPFPLGP